MNYKIYFSILLISLFLLTVTPYNLFAQKQDSTYIEQLKELQAQTNNNNKIITDLKYQINSNKDLSDVAGKIISWTTIILGTIAFIIAISGVLSSIALTKKFKDIDNFKITLSTQIDSTKQIILELSELRNKTEQDLQVERENLSTLKKIFETDKGNLLSAIIPIIEGHWYSYQGENEKAIECYSKANQITPNNAVIVCELNKLLLDKGMVTDVVKNIENFKGLNEKENKKIKLLLINAYRKNAQYETAERLINEFGADNMDGLLLYELGTIMLLKKEATEAEKLFIDANRNYTREENNHKHWVYINLALCQMLMNKQDFSNNLSSAKSILEVQKAKTPKQPYVLGCLGLVFFAEKNYSQSIDCFKSSFDLKLPIMNAKSFLERIQLIEGICDVENGTCKKILTDLNAYINENGKEINA